jgi:dGTPase
VRQLDRHVELEPRSAHCSGEHLQAFPRVWRFHRREVSVKLLSTRRWPDGTPPMVGPGRTDGLRDYDSILFSEPFRRLHDKTQVFPLPEDDHVSTRLTHSLEVASVGRSLGRLTGHLLRERFGDAMDLSPADLGDHVSAGCLAHDIGNPPFGHAGEKAIRSWFKSKDGAPWFAALDSAQRLDFLHFNGNAQGFRVLTHLARGDRAGGLQLTASTLAAMLKYPWLNGTAGRYEAKFGAFQSEIDQLRWVAQETDLPQVEGGSCWARHPLAYLVEAADDMAYLTRDLEDGLRLRLVDYEDYSGALEPIAREGGDYRPPQKPKKRDRITERDAAAYLRTATIGTLIEAVAKAFIDRWPCCGIGKPQGLLEVTPHSGAVAQARKLAKQQCYQANQVMYLELSGHNVLHRLLDLLELAAFRSTGKMASERGKKIANLLSWSEDGGATTEYQRIQRALDVVSGMTDRYAVNFCKRAYGVTLPRQH